MLSGYKTYIVAGVAVIGAIAGMLTGDMTYAAGAQLIITALLGAFIRNGITTTAQK